MSERIPFRLNPMLASLVPKPFDRPGWVYEEKYDGYRILAYKEGTKVTLLSRNQHDRTATFAIVAEAVGRLEERTLLLDGEVVAFDSKGVSRFQLLQRGDVSQHYAVFDCLYRDGRDLRSEPLSRRRDELEAVLAKPSEQLIVSRRLAKNGLTAYSIAKRKGFEGVVAKDNDAPYEERRSNKWLKVKVHQEDEFVIGGFTAPEGSRQHFGALLLGAYRGNDLVYVGKVGTGFTQKTLAELAKAFRPYIRSKPPFVDPPREKNVTWLAPRLVAQIAFQEWTADRKLRQPVFLGLRDDKKPTEVVLPENL
ncbi:MAG: non-homologous end-joining DNA ligase [Candidatus Binatus sp.]|uniref:non-homologous end-joining DNA ligase n=1 Tax=Candidatus Binatus sp. TaxID=2811406 RepID=UPI003BB2059A